MPYFGTVPSTASYIKQEKDPLSRRPGTDTIWVPAGAMRPTVSNGCANITDVDTTAGRPDMQVLMNMHSSPLHSPRAGMKERLHFKYIGLQPQPIPMVLLGDCRVLQFQIMIRLMSRMAPLL